MRNRFVAIFLVVAVSASTVPLGADLPVLPGIGLSRSSREPLHSLLSAAGTTELDALQKLVAATEGGLERESREDPWRRRGPQAGLLEQGLFWFGISALFLGFAVIANNPREVYDDDFGSIFTKNAPVFFSIGVGFGALGLSRFLDQRE